VAGPTTPATGLLEGGLLGHALCLTEAIAGSAIRRSWTAGRTIGVRLPRSVETRVLTH